MYGNEYTDIAAKMKKVINVLENDKECLARIGGSIKNLETDLTQLNKFQIAQKKKDQQISTLVLSASGGSSIKASTAEVAEQQVQAKERERYMGAVNSTLKGLNSIASKIALVQVRPLEWFPMLSLGQQASVLRPQDLWGQEWPWVGWPLDPF
jgi:CHASE3 domain sensor protein